MGAGYSTLSAQLLAMELLREGCHMPCDRSSSMSSTCAICNPSGSNRETEPKVPQAHCVIRDQAAGLRGTSHEHGRGDRQEARWQGRVVWLRTLCMCVSSISIASSEARRLEPSCSLKLSAETHDRCRPHHCLVSMAGVDIPRHHDALPRRAKVMLLHFKT